MNATPRSYWRENGGGSAGQAFTKTFDAAAGLYQDFEAFGCTKPLDSGSDDRMCSVAVYNISSTAPALMALAM
jgi:hypothetical protein